MASKKRLTDIDSLLAEVTRIVANGGYSARIIGLILLAITEAPIADAVEVVHGRKAESAISKTGLMCTACYSDVDRDAVFCKYCGAKMDGERKDNG